jgi:hypothetical protein
VGQVVEAVVPPSIKKVELVVAQATAATAQVEVMGLMQVKVILVVEVVVAFVGQQVVEMFVLAARRAVMELLMSGFALRISR